jgi:hypothetical protein
MTKSESKKKETKKKIVKKVKSIKKINTINNKDQIVSSELDNILKKLDLADEDATVSSNHVQVGKAVQFFIHKKKDKEIDHEKANPVKHVSHETTDKTNNEENLLNMDSLIFDNNSENLNNYSKKFKYITINNISSQKDPYPKVKVFGKKWFGLLESENISPDNVPALEVSHETNNFNQNSKKLELHDKVKEVLAKNQNFSNSKSEYNNDVTYDNFLENTINESEISLSDKNLQDIELRGFGLPAFSLDFLKFWKLNKFKHINNVSHETNQLINSEELYFWHKFAFGVLLGSILFGMSLFIGRFAGQILNPNLSQAITLQNINSFVFLSNNNNEMPKVFKVTDAKAEILKNPVFKAVILGDLVLVYEKIGKVVVFRELEKKIVAVLSL